MLLNLALALQVLVQAQSNIWLSQCWKAHQAFLQACVYLTASAGAFSTHSYVSNAKLVDAGVDYLWRVVLDMPSKEGQLITSSHAVVRASQELLIRLYKQQDSESPVPQQLCQHFVR